MSLKDVVVGDAVAVIRGGWSSLIDRRRVVRVTQTQVILDDGSRWLRRGRKVGADTWSRDYASKWDDGTHQPMVDEHKRIRLAHDIERVKFSGLSMDQLRRIKAIVDEVKT